MPLRPEQAASARDALAKAMYVRLFDWVVERVNKCFPFSSSKYCIGVLDIAGFGNHAQIYIMFILLMIAIFKNITKSIHLSSSASTIAMRNCNNYSTSECSKRSGLMQFPKKLNNSFIFHLSKQEQELYKREGLGIPSTRYFDNQDCIGNDNK